MIQVTNVESAIGKPAGSGMELKPGEADVKVHDAKPHRSKAGNDCLHVTLRTREGDFIDEYVKAEGWRIALLCKCFGVQWEPGEQFNEECLAGQYGRVLTKVEPGVGEYPARLRVARWLKPGESAPAAPAAPAAPVAARQAPKPATRASDIPALRRPARNAPATEQDIPF